MYRREGTTWQPEQKLYAALAGGTSDADADNGFGWSVAISGNRLVVSKRTPPMKSPPPGHRAAGTSLFEASPILPFTTSPPHHAAGHARFDEYEARLCDAKSVSLETNPATQGSNETGSGPAA